jgi:hypothetical protein
LSEAESTELFFAALDDRTEDIGAEDIRIEDIRAEDIRTVDIRTADIEIENEKGRRTSGTAPQLFMASDRKRIRSSLP